MLDLENQYQLQAICEQIATGRSLARLLSAEVRQHKLSEAEFRLLWLLLADAQSNERTCIEQSELVRRLGLSPAQVSTLVEGLRIKQMIEPVLYEEDRRRKYWQLTATGRCQFETIAADVGVFCRELANSKPLGSNAALRREDAA